MNKVGQTALLEAYKRCLNTLSFLKADRDQMQADYKKAEAAVTEKQAECDALYEACVAAGADVPARSRDAELLDPK